MSSLPRLSTDVGFATMKRGLSDLDDHRQVATMLAALSLETRAERARRHVLVVEKRAGRR